MRGVRPERIHLIYVTYDGLLEPLGGSQVVSYLLESPRRDWDVSVNSFENTALTDGARRCRAIYDSLASSPRPAEKAEIAAEVR